MASDRKVLLVALLTWTFINAIQSYFTELAFDEAYYWVWSKHLNWGFYEHPPLVAVLIKAGYAVFQNEFGVRLLTVLSSSFALYFIYVEFIKSHVWLYLSIVFSMFLVHVGGFLTAPDTPLFISTTMFFVFIKYYLNRDNLVHSLLLGLSVVLMAYSKYHASLVLGFAFLSHLKILKRKSFWLIVFAAAIVYSPHIYWLFTEGKAGLDYALSGRFANELKLENILGYFSGQLLVAGPLVSTLLFYAFIKKQPENDFERVLKRTAFCIFGFFFVWSFKGRIEANWTATAFIPLIYLSHKYISENSILTKWCFRLAIPSIAILLFLRADLMFNILPESYIQDKRKEFHGWKEFAKKIDSIAGEKAVLTASYQSASKLWFYRQKLCVPFNNIRPTAYDVWDYNQTLLDKPVVVLYDYIRKDYSLIETPLGVTQLKKIDRFRSYREAKALAVLEKRTFKVNETVPVRVNVFPPSKWAIIGKKSKGIPAFLSYNIMDMEADTAVRYNDGLVWLEDSISEPQQFVLEVEMPPFPGKYALQTQLASKGFVTWWSKEDLFIEVVH